MIFPDAPVPDNKQWALWLLAHDEDEVRNALSVLATRVITGKRQIASEDLHKFVLGILIRTRGKADEKTSTSAPHSRPAVLNAPLTEFNGNC
jgi:hypothetical protein